MFLEISPNSQENTCARVSHLCYGTPLGDCFWSYHFSLLLCYSCSLSTQDNFKLLQQLKSGLKKVISWNKYFSKPELLAHNPNLNHLVEPNFQGVNRLFVLAFENDTQRTSHSGYYLPNVEIKDYNIMINGENIFDEPIKNKVTYENIRKIATGQGDDYITGCLLDYPYLKIVIK